MLQLLISNNFCLKIFFIQCIFKVLFAKKPNCAIRAEAKPVGDQKKKKKKKYNKSCILWLVTAFV